MTHLNGQVVLITGASAGIGAASARAFGAAGARLVLTGRRADRLEAVARTVEAAGGQALAVPADLAQPADRLRLVETSLARWGRVDVLFNNAGFGRIDFVDRLDPQRDLDPLVAVNLLAVMHLTHLVLPGMLRRRQGHIINMASVAAFIAPPTYALYASSKFAVRGFSEGLRREVAPFGVRVSVICPAGTATEFAERAGRPARTPAWLLLSAEQVAQAVVGLARRPRRMVILPWPYHLAVWANRLFPGLVDALMVHLFTRRERREDLR